MATAQVMSCVSFQRMQIRTHRSSIRLSFSSWQCMEHVLLAYLIISDILCLIFQLALHGTCVACLFDYIRYTLSDFPVGIAWNMCCLLFLNISDILSVCPRRREVVGESMTTSQSV